MVRIHQVTASTAAMASVILAINLAVDVHPLLTLVGGLLLLITLMLAIAAST